MTDQAVDNVDGNPTDSKDTKPKAITEADI
jgi:hypothetical protein